MSADAGPLKRIDFSPAWQAIENGLLGKVILIVGATGTLGRAAALHCARNGASVILLGRRVVDLEKLYDQIVAENCPTPAIYPIDLAGAAADDWFTMANTIEEKCERLDGVLFAQAHFQGLCSIALTSPDEWLKAMHVNLNAPVLLTQACLPLLQKADRASLIFVMDDEKTVLNAYWGGYGVAKSATFALCQMLSHELSNSPVRVHALFPAPMSGKLRNKAYLPEVAEGKISLDVAANAVLYLLSAEEVAVQDCVLEVRAG
jgi:NAD(P)-dependent dehydrogenase (short-subunit alcohol dehydrogenase family)